MDTEKVTREAVSGVDSVLKSEDPKQEIINKVNSLRTNISEISGIFALVSRPEDVKKSIRLCDDIGYVLELTNASRGHAVMALLSLLYSSLDSLEEFLDDDTDPDLDSSVGE